MLGGENFSNSSSEATTGSPSAADGTVPVRLGGFSLDVLDAVATPRQPPEKSVEEAVSRYLADRTLRPPGWACLPLPEDEREAAGDVLEVELGAATGREATAEAAAQGVSVDALVSHALMYVWAAEHPHEPAPAASSARRRPARHALRDHGSRT